MPLTRFYIMVSTRKLLKITKNHSNDKDILLEMNSSDEITTSDLISDDGFDSGKEQANSR